MLYELLKKSAFFIVIIVILLIFLFVKDDDTGPTSEVLTSSTTTEQKEILQNEENETNIAIVDVKGEVMRPGVYEIATDARVNDVIQLAGGFSKQADQTMVNLAQKVQDEMIIIIPKVGETAVQANGENSGSKKLKINYATQEEIENLNGIGPSKAQAIIQYRDEFGFFTSVDDLLNVSGIGEKTLENLKDDIQIP